MSKDSYRDKAIDAYGRECDVCGSDELVVVHHIDGNRDNNTLSNLVPICRSCHSKIHLGGSGESELEEYAKKLPAEAMIHEKSYEYVWREPDYSHDLTFVETIEDWEINVPTNIRNIIGRQSDAHRVQVTIEIYESGDKVHVNEVPE